MQDLGTLQPLETKFKQSDDGERGPQCWRSWEETDRRSTRRLVGQNSLCVKLLKYSFIYIAVPETTATTRTCIANLFCMRLDQSRGRVVRLLNRAVVC